MQHPIGFLELPLLMNISMTEDHALVLTAAGRLCWRGMVPVIHAC